MDAKKAVALSLAGWLLLALPNAHALECELKYTAKRVQKDSNWFGSVEKPKFKSGQYSGTGKNKARCTQNALQKIKAEIETEGWEITGYRIIRLKP